MEKKEKEHIKICGISIWRILAYFVVYSVAGFIIETIFGLLTKGVLESRKSFLYGPFCSIYGLGAVLMILPLQKYKKNNYTLFFAGFFIGSIIEYMVSLVGELIFHIKWWDYSDQMFNINGRICVLFSLFWGLLAIYLMSDINPRIDKFIDFVKSKIPANYMKTVIIFSILFLSFDLGITVYALQMFSVRIIHENNLNVSNKQLMDTLYEKIYVNDQKQKDFIYKFFDNEKMIKTFPNIKIEDVDGNLVKEFEPTLYKQIEKSEISSTSFNLIQQGMEQMVERDSRFKSVRDGGIKMAGKTGTAQHSKAHADHVLFVGYAPAGQPEIAVSARIAYGYNSGYPAEIGRDMVRKYFNLADDADLVTGTASSLGSEIRGD